MFRSITNNVSKNLSAGGELTGDVTITGDLSVTGSSSITVNEVIQGTSTIDVDSTEAFLVRKDGDGGDVLTVDTSNMDVTVNGAKNTTTFSVTNNWSTTNDYIRIALNDATIRSTVLDSGARNLILAPLGNDALTLHSTSGGVVSAGIGESSPDTKLEIAGAHISAKGLLHLDSTDHSFIALDAHSSSHDSGIYFQENGTTQMIIDHDGSDNRMRFHDGSSTFMTLTSGGLLGIGTDSPSQNLHVEGVIIAHKDVGDAGLYVDSATNSDAKVRFLNGGSESWTIYSDGSETNDPLKFYDGATSAVMMTLNNGKVGIGTDSPSKDLHVAKSGEAQIIIDSHVAGASGSSIRLRQSRNATVGSHTVVNDNDEVGDITFQGSDGNSYESVASIRGKVDDGSISDGSIGGSLVFKTGSSNGTRLILDANSRISLSNNDSGASGRSYNTIFGYLAGDDLENTGQYNSFFGDNTGHQITVGDYNAAFGLNALDGATHADRVTAIGSAALRGAVTSDAIGATGVGFGALNQLSSGAGNVAVGYQAGYAVTTGSRNLAIGHNALYQADVCDDSIAIGFEALGGTDAGTNNKNIAIGNYALDAALANSIHNVAIGYNALTASTGGASNVAIGGSGAGGAITTADRIVAIGDGALGGAAQSQGNTGVGYASLYNATGAKNTAFGYQAANTVTDGTESTVVGWDADVTGSGAVNQTVIGSETTGQADNSVTLGNGDVTAVYMAQDSGARVYCARIDAITDLSGDYAVKIHNDGNNSNRFGLELLSGADDASGTNYAVGIKDGDGGEQGYITFTGGTVTYGPFTANHDVELPTDDKDNGYPYGTLVEHTEVFYKQKNGSDTERGILYKAQKSSSAYAKNVLGAYAGKYPDKENLHQVYILGDGHILCNGEKGNIAIGDGICTSSTDGQGMKADKMAMCIGIAQEAVTFSGSESKLVAVQYGLQQFTPWE